MKKSVDKYRHSSSHQIKTTIAMPTTPIDSNMDYVSFDLLIGGKDISDAVDLLSVEVEREINRVSRAHITIAPPPGTSLTDWWPVLKKAQLEHGEDIEIKLGYQEDNHTVFRGLLTGHRLKTASDGRPTLEIICHDKAIKLTLGEKYRAFTDKKDSEVFNGILQEAGLAWEVEATDTVHPLMIQPELSDWDFILTRAEANGMIVHTDDGKLSVERPTDSDDLDFLVEFGVSALEFDGELDATHQLKAAEAANWNFPDQVMDSFAATEVTVAEPANTFGGDFAGIMGSAAAAFRTSAPLQPSERKRMAEARLLRSRLSCLRGRVRFPGNATPALNKLISLKGFGASFDGQVLVSRVHHTVIDGEWHTEVGFGLSPEWYHQTGKMTTSDSMLPNVRGLHHGVVKKIDHDPEGEYRVQLEIPILGTRSWARMGSSYATKGAGTFFLPEVGDEVIAGFFNDDPRHPVILGSMYSSKHPAPYPADAENAIKAFTTRAQLKIEFNDKDQVLTLETPGGNRCTFSDTDSSVVIADQHQNTVTLDKRGITFNSAKDIILKAKGNVNITAQRAISAQANGGDLSLKGLNVEANARVGISLKGGATAELSARGQTTVKGAMVMIN
jgi:Rhs element Vgr protein